MLLFLDNFYDACEVFEYVFKNAFNCILKTIKDNFYDACEVFENVILLYYDDCEVLENVF